MILVSAWSRCGYHNRTLRKNLMPFDTLALPIPIKTNRFANRLHCDKALSARPGDDSETLPIKLHSRLGDVTRHCGILSPPM